jgi:hypothetical protein
MDAFPLERFTTDPKILKYSKDLRDIFDIMTTHITEFHDNSDSKIIIIRTSKYPMYYFIRAIAVTIIKDEDYVLNILSPIYKDHHILNGLFLKLYECQTVCKNWPPLTYPNNAPLLVYVPGYHGESFNENVFRVLKNIGADITRSQRLAQGKPYVPMEPYEPDLSDYPATHIFKRSWLSDPLVRLAYDALKKVDLKDILNSSYSDVRLLTGYEGEHKVAEGYVKEFTINEDTHCSNMIGNPSRFYDHLRSSTTLEGLFEHNNSTCTEFFTTFHASVIMPPLLTRYSLAWAQTLFVILGPSENSSHKFIFPVELDVSDCNWIQMTTVHKTYTDMAPTIIQGAYMHTFIPFLDMYYKGVLNMSESVKRLIRGNETEQEFNQRLSLSRGRLINQPFTLYGKIPKLPSSYIHLSAASKSNHKSTNFSPLMSNLRRLRKTLKKRSWHFWGPGPAKLIEEFINRYGISGTLLMKSPEITAAATALQRHHTTANKDALIQALKDAIRTYKAGKPPIEDSSQMFSTPIKISNLGGTDYSAYNAGIKDLEAEMAKPWYARTWGKSKAVIKQLLETYLELFSDKGDLNIVNALLAVKKYKSHDAIEALKTAIQTRRYTAHSLPILEGDVRKIPLPQAIRNEQARLDPFHKPANIRGEQPRDQVVNTNYSTYNAGIKELDAEMAKPWYAQTWGKSKAIIKQLLDTYLTTFIARDDTEIIRALEGLKKLKSQDAVDMLKAAIQARKIRNAERARIPVYKSDAKDYADDIVDAMNVFKTLKNLNARILLQVAIEVRVHNGDPNLPPRSIAYSLLHEEVEVPRPPVRKTQKSQKTQKPKSPSPIKELTGPQVEKQIQKVTQAATAGLQPRTAFINSPVTSPVTPTPIVPLFVSQQSNKPKPNLYISDNSNVLTLSDNIPKNESVQKPNVVTSKLPTNANTVSVPLVSGQAGGFAPSLMSSFVSNGMSLLPVASYLGYRQMKNRKTRRK